MSIHCKNEPKAKKNLHDLVGQLFSIEYKPFGQNWRAEMYFKHWNENLEIRSKVETGQCLKEADVVLNPFASNTVQPQMHYQ